MGRAYEYEKMIYAVSSARHLLPDFVRRKRFEERWERAKREMSIALLRGLNEIRKEAQVKTMRFRFENESKLVIQEESKGIIRVQLLTAKGGIEVDLKIRKIEKLNLDEETMRKLLELINCKVVELS